MLRLILLLCLSLIFLTSCTNFSSEALNENQTHLGPKLSWQEREKQLASIKRWHIKGKIAVQTSKDAGSASVDWTLNGASYVISLYGPFGGQGLNLSGRPGRVTLVDSKGKRYTASSPEALLGRIWGYHVPISNLIYWVRGLPVPNLAAQKQLDSYNRLLTLQQMGWLVQFSDYTQIGQRELPRRIDITSSQLKTKLIIYQWQVVKELLSANSPCHPGIFARSAKMSGTHSSSGDCRNLEMDPGHAAACGSVIPG